MKTALLAGSMTLFFLGINTLFGNELVSGFESLTLYFVISTWINVIKK